MRFSLSKRIEAWAHIHAGTPKAEWALAGLSFAESSFFPIPPDVMLAAMLSTGASNWKRLALITTITSVLGGLFGYAIGYFFFEAVGGRLVSFYHLENELVRIGTLFDTHAFWTVFTAGFTPIPYKLFTIAGGVFGINLFTFIVASILSRGARFFLVAYLSARYGEVVARTIFRMGDAILLILVVLVLLVLFL